MRGMVQLASAEVKAVIQNVSNHDVRLCQHWLIASVLWHSCSLLDNRDEGRLNNPLVGGQELEAMDAGGGNYCPVRRISQRATQCGDLLRYVRGEGNDSEGGIRVQLLEELIQASA